MNFSAGVFADDPDEHPFVFYMSPWGLEELSIACKYQDVRERFRWAGGIPENVENIASYVQTVQKSILKLKEVDFLNEELMNITLPVHKNYQWIFLIYSSHGGRKGYWDFASICIAQKVFDRHDKLLIHLVKRKIVEFNGKNDNFRWAKDSADFKKYESWLTKMELGTMILRRFYANHFVKSLATGGMFTAQPFSNTNDELKLQLPANLCEKEFATVKEIKIEQDAIWVPIDMGFTLADCFITVGKQVYAFRACLGPYLSVVSLSEGVWTESILKRCPLILVVPDMSFGNFYFKESFLKSLPLKSIYKMKFDVWVSCLYH